MTETRAMKGDRKELLMIAGIIVCTVVQVVASAWALTSI